MSATENGAQNASDPMENPVLDPEAAASAAKPPSGLQAEFSEASAICHDYIALVRRFTAIARAVDDTLAVAEVPPPGAPAKPKDVSLLGGLRFLHRCHREGPLPMLADIAGKLEAALSIGRST